MLLNQRSKRKGSNHRMGSKKYISKDAIVPSQGARRNTANVSKTELSALTYASVLDALTIITMLLCKPLLSKLPKTLPQKLRILITLHPKLLQFRRLRARQRVLLLKESQLLESDQLRKGNLISSSIRRK